MRLDDGRYFHNSRRQVASPRPEVRRPEARKEYPVRKERSLELENAASAVLILLWDAKKGEPYTLSQNELIRRTWHQRDYLDEPSFG